MSSKTHGQLQASGLHHDRNLTCVAHEGGDMTPVDAVIVAGHWISALNCVNVPSTVAVQLEQKYTGSVAAVINGGCVRVVMVTESVVRPGILR